MKKKTILIQAISCLILVLTIYVIVHKIRDSSPKPYNVLLISFDTLRADRLNCYGFKRHITSPNINALAKDGILFENCITQSPWTTPSHLSMLTSLYPSTHGVTMSFIELWKGLYDKRYRFLKLPENRITLSEVLKFNGFKTCAFTGGGTLEPVIGFGQGFDMYDTSMYKLDDQNMGKMYDWIKENNNRPFFLFWHNFEVHAPYLHCDFLSEILLADTANQIHTEHSKLRSNLFRNVRLKQSLHLLSYQEEILRKHNSFNKDVCEALYLGGILSADRYLGKLMGLLREEGLYDRTLIVFTSDHGEEFGDHIKPDFYNKHGSTVYEEMIHVPLVIKLPFQEHAGTRVSSVCSVIDIMPSVLEFLSIEPKQNEMQGVSLIPLWENKSSALDGVAFTEALCTPYEQKSLRTNRYKFFIMIDPENVSIVGRKNIPKELCYKGLHDLYEDPEEKTNLLGAHLNKDIANLSTEFEQRIREHISKQSGETQSSEINSIMVEKLKSLGYIQ